MKRKAYIGVHLKNHKINQTRHNEPTYQHSVSGTGRVSSIPFSKKCTRVFNVIGYLNNEAVDALCELDLVWLEASGVEVIDATGVPKGPAFFSRGSVAPLVWCGVGWETLCPATSSAAFNSVASTGLRAPPPLPRLLMSTPAALSTTSPQSELIIHNPICNSV